MTSPEKDKMVGEKRRSPVFDEYSFSRGPYLNTWGSISFTLSPIEVINFAVNLHTRILQRHYGPGSWK